MAMFCGDIIIKNAIEFSLEDIRKNTWLIDDCFGNLLTNPLLKEKYGIAEVNRAKEFILNNNIPIYLPSPTRILLKYG